MYLVNTAVVASYPNGRVDAVALLRQLLVDGVAISVISCAEVYEGDHYGPDPARHLASFHAFSRGARVIAVNRTVARHLG